MEICLFNLILTNAETERSMQYLVVQLPSSSIIVAFWDVLPFERENEGRDHHATASPKLDSRDWKAARREICEVVLFRVKRLIWSVRTTKSSLGQEKVVGTKVYSKYGVLVKSHHALSD